MNILWLITAGVVIHIIFLKSIFDIYFTSPLVHGMTPQSINGSPPAKRLVLISCDGLRADKFYEDDPQGQPWMPFLRRIAKQNGTSGVSNTRVPTESRPGHVAMIAGFYEDVSAVTKGWKENPVEFDSVFNQSRYTWGWGSPDIIPIFTRIKKDSGELVDIPHIFPDTYSAQFEDFAASPIQLDFWVFDQIKEFFERSKSNATLRRMLNEEKIVFFLHLLGMDTTGHVSKPQSKIYTDNMRLLDDRIRLFVEDMDTFYDNDGQTAFLLTSDHGMTDWGSHGSGQLEETATPIVAWGAGVTTPADPIRRVDVEQADLAPLMSALIGIPIPANSVGVLPLDYLGASPLYKGEAYLANARQILQQVDVLRSRKESESLMSVFKPFPELDIDDLSKSIAALERRIRSSEDANSIADTAKLIRQGLKAMDYYQKYDRSFLQLLVALGYAGWMIYITVILLKSATFTVNPDQKIPFKILFAGLASGAATISYLFAQGSPAIHMLYALLPVLTWTACLAEVYSLRRTVISAAKKDKSLLSVLVSLGLLVAGTELLVLTFFHRPAVSVGLLFCGSWMYCMTKASGRTKALWLATSVILAVFPLLPVVGKSRHIYLVWMTGLGGLAAVFVIARKCSHGGNERFLRMQAALMAAAVAIVYLTDRSVALQASPGFVIHCASWLLLGFGFLFPFYGSTQIIYRFLNVAVSLMTSYLLMSVAYEALFLLTLTLHLFLWIVLESEESMHKISLATRTIFEASSQTLFAERRSFSLADLRRAFFFIFFILAAFFGTGNIASLNSFDPASAFSFVTVFRPFVMGAILLCKVMIPFVLIGCAFHVIYVVCKVPMRSMCLVVLLISDFMALHFFFLVKTEGSWLDIGTSISHYVMVMTLIDFTCLLSYLSSLLMTKKLSVPLTKFQAPGNRDYDM